MESFLENLKTVRARKGLTAEQVDAHLGVRTVSIEDFESGLIKLSAHTALELAHLYEVSVDELLGNLDHIHHTSTQEHFLGKVGTFFHKSEMDLIYLDPVIRNFAERYRTEIFDKSLFEILTMSLPPERTGKVLLEILHTLASLMSADMKITEPELNFLERLCEELKIGSQTNFVRTGLSRPHLPDWEVFDGKKELKHFLLWMMFFLSRSDGKINTLEKAFMEECCASLHLERADFLYIQSFFEKDVL